MSDVNQVQEASVSEGRVLLLPSLWLVSSVPDYRAKLIFLSAVCSSVSICSRELFSC